jgi:transposase-like protein
MSRKSKIDPYLKVELVEKYLRGEISITEACRIAGLSNKTTHPFRNWINIYKNEGPSGFQEQKKNRAYSKELKLFAVNDYLNGEGTEEEIARKYGIRSDTQLSNWIRVYNTHGEIKSRGSGGGSCMRKARQTTYEERLEIVQDCLANGRDYGAAALKYQCSYQQVRNWVLRYEKMGSAGLQDRRGKRIGTLPGRTPEEELRDKIAELERRNRDLQMENDLLKKVRELEMKDRCL